MISNINIMILPNLRPIYVKDDLNPNPKRSVFYTFTKALKDLDYCNNNNKPFYMSSFAALNLPKWFDNNDPQTRSFYYRFRKSTSTPVGDIEFYSNEFTQQVEEELTDDLTLDNNYVNPNYVIPKILGYYFENILRQENTGGINIDCPRISEVAFWKTLMYLGITDINSLIQYVGKISTVSYTQISNNHGWAQIMCEIPNFCKHFDNTNPNIWCPSGVDLSVGVADNHDACIFDSGMSFDFSNHDTCLNFVNIYDINQNILNTDVADIQFNALLLFYKDADCFDENGIDNGMEKLYGINFIMPFEKLLPETPADTSYELPSFKHKTNSVQTFGYNFRFNIKSCTNDETRESVPIFVPVESSFFDLYSEVLTKLNNFLEINGL